MSSHLFPLLTGSQNKLSSSNVQFEDKNENLEARNIERTKKTVSAETRCLCGRVHRITRPLRVVELLILAALFALTVYLKVKKGEELLTDVASLLLITLFTTYLFILSVDLISQIIWKTLPDTPMFVFVVLGFLLFVAAAEGIYVLLYLKKPNVLLLGLMILSIIVAVLFLVDVTLIILNWRQTCMRIDKCPFSDTASNFTAIHKPAEYYSKRIAVRSSESLILRDNARDVTTSISNYERLSHPDLVNLHKFRKVGVGHRREYINRSVDAPSLTQVKVIQVQTETPEQKTVSDVETLMVANVKEEPVQTIPKCPVCANNWDPQGIRRVDTFGLCPTFLHLAQGFGVCKCCPAASPAPETNQVEFHTESMSATDLTIRAKRKEKPDSRKNSQE